MNLIFIEVSGDLISTTPGHSLAHCVSEDLGMFKSIAKQFNARYGNIEKDHLEINTSTPFGSQKMLVP